MFSTFLAIRYGPPMFPGQSIQWWTRLWLAGLSWSNNVTLLASSFSCTGPNTGINAASSWFSSISGANCAGDLAIPSKLGGPVELVGERASRRLLSRSSPKGKLAGRLWLVRWRKMYGASIPSLTGNLLGIWWWEAFFCSIITLCTSTAASERAAAADLPISSSPLFCTGTAVTIPNKTSASYQKKISNKNRIKKSDGNQLISIVSTVSYGLTWHRIQFQHTRTANWQSKPYRWLIDYLVYFWTHFQTKAWRWTGLPGVSCFPVIIDEKWKEK